MLPDMTKLKGKFAPSRLLYNSEKAEGKWVAKDFETIPYSSITRTLHE